MKSIISATEALNLSSRGDIILVDASGGANAYAAYLESRLKGALFVSLEDDLSTLADPAQGGRHPLPSSDQFAMALERLGITQDSHVVVYDRMSGANAAARFWWMMKAQGHIAIQVLDGGLQAAVKANFPTEDKTTDVPQKTVSAKSYKTIDWKLPCIMMNELEALIGNPQSLIVDVREAQRYQGLEEPIDLVAGHIPSAVNIPFKGNLNQDGLFKSKEELQDLYMPYLENKSISKVTIHCGSGVTACHTLLALELAGFTLPNLYVGSWSEWSRNKL